MQNAIFDPHKHVTSCDNCYLTAAQNVSCKATIQNVIFHLNTRENKFSSYCEASGRCWLCRIMCNNLIFTCLLHEAKLPPKKEHNVWRIRRSNICWNHDATTLDTLCRITDPPFGLDPRAPRKPIKTNHSFSLKSKRISSNCQLGKPVFFGSRQPMVAKMNGRAEAKKMKNNEKTYDSGEMLSSADAPYKRCVCQRNASI